MNKKKFVSMSYWIIFQFLIQTHVHADSMNMNSLRTQHVHSGKMASRFSFSQTSSPPSQKCLENNLFSLWNPTGNGDTAKLGQFFSTWTMMTFGNGGRGAKNVETYVPRKIVETQKDAREAEIRKKAEADRKKAEADARAEEERKRRNAQQKGK